MNEEQLIALIAALGIGGWVASGLQWLAGRGARRLSSQAVVMDLYVKATQMAVRAESDLALAKQERNEARRQRDECQRENRAIREEMAALREAITELRDSTVTVTAEAHLKPPESGEAKAE